MEKQSTNEIKERIKDKIKQIEQFVQELSEIRPLNFEQYQQDVKTKAACERYCEKIPQAFIDLALLTIKYKILPQPKDENSAFEILEQNKIISHSLSKNLQDAKSMRNFIAHEYGRIDDSIIFEAIETELEQDAKELIKNIRKEIQ